MAQSEKPDNPPRWEPGDRVRVKSGVTDPDFPDIPLGGWAGTIAEIEQSEGEITYLIAWDRETLKAIHPVYRKRCERDGLEFETMWLGEDDVEPDDGTPVRVEQPTEIKTAPLSEKDQDDRARMALGLTHDDPLPEVGPETLLAYHRYLSANLKLPLSVTAWEEAGPFSSRKRTVSLTELVDPEDDDDAEEYGLLCRGQDREGVVEVPLDRVEVPREDPNYRLIDDYSYWFANWR